MTMFLRLTAAALVVAGVVTSANAQVQIEPKNIEIQPFPGQPGGPIQPGGFNFGNPQILLLKDKGVQKELKLTDDQIKKVDELVKQQADVMKNLNPKEAFVKMKEMTEASQKAINDVLNKDQTMRLGQLATQAKGPSALFDPMVTKELDLSIEQRQKIGKAIGEAMQKAMTGFKDAKPEEFMKKIGEATKAAMDEAVKVLTPEQQTKWKAIVGAPYDGVLPMGGFGPPIGPPGGIQIQPLPPRQQRFPNEFLEERRVR